MKRDDQICRLKKELLAMENRALNREEVLANYSTCRRALKKQLKDVDEERYEMKTRALNAEQAYREMEQRALSVEQAITALRSVNKYLQNELSECREKIRLAEHSTNVLVAKMKTRAMRAENTIEKMEQKHKAANVEGCLCLRLSTMTERALSAEQAIREMAEERDALVMDSLKNTKSDDDYRHIGRLEQERRILKIQLKDATEERDHIKKSVSEMGRILCDLQRSGLAI